VVPPRRPRPAHDRVHPRPDARTRPTTLLATLLAAAALAGCTDAPATATALDPLTVCADGPTVPGIDVSKWQGEIDWDAVAGDGIAFAFIRTSHGLNTLDEWYDFNWTEARRVGVRRGTYQYFSPGQDAVAQADLLLERMGPLQPGDLPPVLDVEQSDGQSAAAIVAGIHAWTDRIESRLAVRPIIYTAKYFWQDSVGAPDDFLDLPLWVANYGVQCPLMADPWTRWNFWQYTSTGSVAGIAGNVDRNHWNGTEDDLAAFAWAPDELTVPPLIPPPTGDPSGGCSTTPAPRGLAAPALLAALALIGRRRRRA